MKSLDTNLLLYAINEDCPEHEACADFVRQALAEPDSWIVADQVWFEQIGMAPLRVGMRYDAAPG